MRSNISFCVLGFLCFLLVQIVHENILTPNFNSDSPKDFEKPQKEHVKTPELIHRKSTKKSGNAKKDEIPVPFDYEEKSGNFRFGDENVEQFADESENQEPEVVSTVENAFKTEDDDYLINESNACKKKVPTMLLAVAGAVYGFERREIIRQTWGKYAETENVKLLFFVGVNGDPETQKNLLAESLDNHDIIQENYIESYWNLTRKTIGQIKWKKEFCPESEILAHLDDDVFIDVPKILDYLTNQKNTKFKSWIGCMWKMGGAPVRRTGKYAVTEDEFAASKYPGSCMGPCYFISGEANDQLVEESFKHKEFKLEDMYVTGVLRDERSIPIFPIPRGNMLCQHLGKNGEIMHSEFVYKEATVEERMWKAWELFGPGGEMN